MARALYKRQVTAVAAHHFDDEGALVAGGRAGDGIHGLGDAVQGAICADGHIGTGEIVVDRTDQPDDQQVGVGGGHFGADLAALGKLGHDGRPFLAEDVRAGQRAVAADDDQPVDPILEQVAGSRPASFGRAESFAAGRPDDGPAALQDPANRIPVHLSDVVATFHQSLVAFIDGVDFRPFIQGGAHHGPHGRVHSLGIATTGQNCNSFCCHSCFQTPDTISIDVSRHRAGSAKALQMSEKTCRVICAKVRIMSKLYRRK